MIPSIPYCLAGYRALTVSREHAASLLELCRRFGIPYENFKSRGDGGITLRFRRRDADRLERLCAEAGIPAEAGREGGLPRLLRRLAARPGILAGTLVGAVLLAASGGVIWDIRISGNSTVSDREVRESLAACGLTVGTPLRGFRADVTENRVLLCDDRLAWLSINRKGTVAYVEVREAVRSPEDPPEHPRDLVAARGGIIEYIELEEGNVRVTAGQTVSEGDILVSGIYDSAQLGMRVESAKAKVFARTTRVFSVEIPLSYSRKVYLTDRGEGGKDLWVEKQIIFFGRHIKFSKKTGHMGNFCDTIEDEKSWGLGDGVGFPLSTRTVWCLPYTFAPATRSYAEAEELAYFALARYLSAIPGGATLLGKEITVSHGEDCLTMTCVLTAIEDIAAERLIQIAD